MGRAKFEVFEGSDNAAGSAQWYWHLRGANGEIVCSSEGYATKGSAMRAVKRLSEIAVSAKVEVWS